MEVLTMNIPKMSLSNVPKASTTSTNSMTTTTLDRILYTCNRCLTKHPFEDLDFDLMQCKNCNQKQKQYTCHYCREEFQSETKTTNPICPRCTKNVARFGNPRSCENCNIVAAFTGNKCQRCFNYHQTYGEPGICTSCKLRAAFSSDKALSKDKLFCFHCRMARKRSKLQAKSESSKRRTSSLLGLTSSSLSKRDSSSLKSVRRLSNSNDSSSSRLDYVKGFTISNGTFLPAPQSPSKTHQTNTVVSSDSNLFVKPNEKLLKVKKKHSSLRQSDSSSNDGSEMVALIEKLREKVSQAERTLFSRNQELHSKEMIIKDLETSINKERTDYHNKIIEFQKQHNDEILEYQNKIIQLTKQEEELKNVLKKQDKE